MRPKSHVVSRSSLSRGSEAVCAELGTPLHFGCRSCLPSGMTRVRFTRASRRVEPQQRVMPERLLRCQARQTPAPSTSSLCSGHRDGEE